VQVVQEGGAVLPEAVHEAALQRGGHLEELIGVEERRHGGVETGRSWSHGLG